MDKLEKLYNLQYSLQEKKGIINKINKNKKLKQEYINQMIIACQEELIEIIRETNYKNPDYVNFGWKKNQSYNQDKMQEEIVDLIHFVFNLMIACNLKPQKLFDLYLLKNKINLNRDKNNY